MAKILANTCNTRYDYNNEEFAKTVCQVLEINYNT